MGKSDIHTCKCGKFKVDVVVYPPEFPLFRGATFSQDGIVLPCPDCNTSPYYRKESMKKVDIDVLARVLKELHERYPELKASLYPELAEKEEEIKRSCLLALSTTTRRLTFNPRHISLIMECDNGNARVDTIAGQSWYVNQGFSETERAWLKALQGVK